MAAVEQCLNGMYYHQHWLMVRFLFQKFQQNLHGQVRCSILISVLQDKVDLF